VSRLQPQRLDGVPKHKKNPGVGQKTVILSQVRAAAAATCQTRCRQEGLASKAHQQARLWTYPINKLQFPWL
jgi:hypothetical protein